MEVVETANKAVLQLMDVRATVITQNNTSVPQASALKTRSSALLSTQSKIAKVLSSVAPMEYVAHNV
jgi:shikimate kinase